MQKDTTNNYEHTIFSLGIDCNFLFYDPDNKTPIFIEVLQEIGNLFLPITSIFRFQIRINMKLQNISNVNNTLM